MVRFFVAPCRLLTLTLFRRPRFLFTGLIIVCLVVTLFLLRDEYPGLALLAAEAPSQLPPQPPPTRQVDLPCTLPVLDPYDPSIIEYVDVLHNITCNLDGFPLLFDVDVDGGQDLVLLQDPKVLGYSDCCYEPFKRGKGDREQIFSGDCFPLDTTPTGPRRWSIPPQHEYIAVYCKKKGFIAFIWSVLKWLVTGNGRTLVDMFNFVRPQPKSESNSSKTPRSSQPNVLVLGLDSISHMNLIRTMPEAHNFLVNELRAIEMKGQNLIEENTFTNVVPMLTSYNQYELEEVCWDKPNGHFDSCPFLWKNYSQAGYITSYGEDASNFGNFLYQKQGFRVQPTDYYTIPIVNAIEGYRLRHNGDGPRDEHVCYGPRLGWQILWANIQKVALHARQVERPFFQFTWSTSLAHSDNNYPGAADKFLVNLLQWLRNGNYLNDTILLVVSDHGSREGGIRETAQGAMEARMPFLYFVFPDWFKNKYSLAVENVVANSATRTTPFDVHEVLVDLLDLSRVEDEAIMERSLQLENKPTPPRGISLFLPVPNPRSCFKAGIGLHACACAAPASLNAQNPNVVDAAAAAVNSINMKLANYPQCTQLTLSAVRAAHELYKSKESQVIRITFETAPSFALFEVSMMSGNGSWSLVGTVSRLNLYGSQSACVNEYVLKNLCYCI